MNFPFLTNNAFFIKTNITDHDKLCPKFCHPIRVKPQKIRGNHIVRIAESHKMKASIFLNLFKSEISCR